MSEKKKRDKSVKYFDGPSLTKQSFKDDADINRLMTRYQKVQSIEFLNQYNGHTSGYFGDFSQVPDYRSALELVRAAEDIFYAQPAVVRADFDNNPALFLDFCQNPVNKAKLIEWGLVPNDLVKPEDKTPVNANNNVN